MQWSREEREALRSAWADGGDIAEIARRMKRSTAAIAFQLATLGIWDAATRDRFLKEQRRARTRERQAGWPAARAAALQRDGNACRCCGSRADIEVHHIIEWIETRGHDQQNLITLCGPCHVAIHRGTSGHHAGFWTAMLRATEEERGRRWIGQERPPRGPVGRDARAPTRARGRARARRRVVLAVVATAAHGAPPAPARRAVSPGDFFRFPQTYERGGRNPSPAVPRHGR